MVAGDVLVAQMWAQVAQVAMDNSPDLAFCFPREGFAIYADNACILRESKHVDLALRISELSVGAEGGGRYCHRDHGSDDQPRGASVAAVKTTFESGVVSVTGSSGARRMVSCVATGGTAPARPLLDRDQIRLVKQQTLGRAALGAKLEACLTIF